jgi:hypothetical protein
MPSITTALGASLFSVLLPWSQAANLSPSRELREHLKQERFDIVTSIRGLPLGVRGALQTLFASREYDVQRDIAQPGADFLGTNAAADPNLPLRRLIAAECSWDHCLVYYERGGRALTFHVALFHWDPEATRFEAGGQAPKPLTTIGDVWKTLLSGGLTDSSKRW